MTFLSNDPLFSFYDKIANEFKNKIDVQIWLYASIEIRSTLFVHYQRPFKSHIEQSLDEIDRVIYNHQ